MDDNKVAVLLEDLRAQFRTFGEGLAGLHEEMREFREETNNRFDNLESQNRQEHQLLMQMVKELDTEVVKMKRVKLICPNPTHPAFSHPLCFEVCFAGSFSKDGKETNNHKNF